MPTASPVAAIAKLSEELICNHSSKAGRTNDIRNYRCWHHCCRGVEGLQTRRPDVPSCFLHEMSSGPLLPQSLRRFRSCNEPGGPRRQRNCCHRRARRSRTLFSPSCAFARIIARRQSDSRRDPELPPGITAPCPLSNLRCTAAIGRARSIAHLMYPPDPSLKALFEKLGVVIELDREEEFEAFTTATCHHASSYFCAWGRLSPGCCVKAFRKQRRAFVNQILPGLACAAAALLRAASQS